MSLRTISIVGVLAVAVLAYVAWTRFGTPPQPPQPAAPPSQSAGGGAMGMPPSDMASPPATEPGIAWDKPARWLLEERGGMRMATYVIAGQGGVNAECAVYYFGPGQGGDIEANLTRWAGEFENPAAAKRSTRSVDGMAVSHVSVRGTYQAHAGMAEGSSGPKKDWALLGAIVEGPNGRVFFKLTGPSKIVSGAEKEFDGMLASLRHTNRS